MLSVVIVSYNVKSFLRQCLKSIYDSEFDLEYEITVVDNYSFDHSADMVKSEFPNVKFIQNKSNLGFSRAINLGIINSLGDCICILNPDTIVEKQTLSKLHKYYTNNKFVGILGAKIINPDGSTQLASKRSFPSLWVGISKFFGLNKLFPKSKFFAEYNQTYIEENQITEVDAVSGSCMVFSKKIFRDLNGFDESFFLYFEDTDFCARVLEFGQKVIYFPDAKVIHFKGESHKHAPFDTIKIFHESMGIFFQKHKYRFKLWPITWLIIKIGIVGHLVQSHIKLNKARVFTIFIDSTIILTSFIFSILIWYSTKYQNEISLNLILKHWPLIFCYLIIWFLTAINFKIYSEKLISYGRAFASCILTFLISSVFVYYISFIAYSRVVLILSSVLCGLIIPAWRIFTIIRFKNRKSSISQFTPLFTRNIAILGTNSEAFNVGKILLNSPAIDFDLKGYIEFKVLDKSIVRDGDILGRQSDLYDIIKKYKLNEIIIPEKIYSGDLLFNLFKTIRELNISFKYISTDDNVLIGKGIAEEIGPIKLINLQIPLFDQFNIISKRLFDLILAFLLITTTLPLQVLLYLINGVNFKIIWGDKSTQLKLYYFKSRFNLFKNILLLYPILKGNMTFVGCQQIIVENSNPKLMFKPGLTGLGHLKSPNSNRDLSVFDEYYIKNHSFLLDLEIILKSLLKI